METIWIDAAEFEIPGQWKLETQFVREMGQGYLLACETPGVPVKDAITSFKIGESGYYRVFVRTKNWHLPESPGQFQIGIDDMRLENICGTMRTTKWHWEIAGDIPLKKGCHRLSLIDLTGWLSRCAAVIITNDFDFTPSPEKEILLKQRQQIKGLREEVIDKGEWDFVVVGAGPGGVAAAISAARHGMKTALICGRPFVGGNASNEGTIGLDGAGAHHDGWQETGIPDEIKALRRNRGAGWQEAMEILLAGESLISVFQNELCISAQTEKGIIHSILCTDCLTLEKHRFKAPLFADCSGDGWLAYYAGAAYHVGREAQHEFQEDLAPLSPDTLTMSGCLCGRNDEGQQMLAFWAEDMGEPVEFAAPSWAIKLPQGDALHREPTSFHSAQWWMENRNDYDDLWDEEFVRDELVRLAVGYFDWLKNSFTGREATVNYRLIKLPLHNSKRENRRIVGDYMLTEKDYREGVTHPDTVTYTGWTLDVHHPLGMFSGSEGPYLHDKEIPITSVPYRCLYSKNINNLFMASRCSSVTHVALGSTRVEATIATMGQAVGVAAGICKRYGVLPRAVYETHIQELQQTLLRDDQTIPGIKNEDPDDLALAADIVASSTMPRNKQPENAHYAAENLHNGVFRPDAAGSNAWASDPGAGLPQSVTVKFKSPQKVRSVQITADTDLINPRFNYQPRDPDKTLPQDVTVDVLQKGKWIPVAQKAGNVFRQIRVTFPEITADQVRVNILKAQDADYTVLSEIRVY